MIFHPWIISPITIVDDIAFIYNNRLLFYIRRMGQNITISISMENYNELRKFGYAGQTLNQAIGKLLATAGEKSA